MNDVTTSESSPSSSGLESHSKSDVLPPCRVCGYKASGLHYGLNTCEACKGFFKRSIRRTKEYRCLQKGKCIIGPKERKLCPKCRFEKCLSFGMSKAAVKPGRYTHEHRTRNILEVQKLRRKPESTTELIQQPSAQTSEQQKSLTALDCRPSLDFDDIIQRVVDAHDMCILHTWTPGDDIEGQQDRLLEEHKLKVEIFGRREPLSEEQYEEIFQTTGIDVDDRQELMTEYLRCCELYLQHYINFVKKIPQFSELPVADQANLVKYSAADFYSLEYFLGYSSDKKVIALPDGKGIHMDELRKLFTPDFIKADFKIAESLMKLNLEREEIILLIAVCVMFTDRCELQERDKVEEMQWKLVQCLTYLLEKNHKNERTLFARIISRLTAIREFTVCWDEVDRKMLLWPNIDKFPLFAGTITC